MIADGKNGSLQTSPLIYDDVDVAGGGQLRQMRASGERAYALGRKLYGPLFKKVVFDHPAARTLNVPPSGGARIQIKTTRAAAMITGAANTNG
jgi:hypothetical protein